jgi:hypothetical protein
MVGKRLAAFSDWVGKSKLRRFSALLVFWIVFDQLFRYFAHSILGWPRESWAHSLFYGAWMALWFTVLSLGWSTDLFDLMSKNSGIGKGNKSDGQTN